MFYFLFGLINGDILFHNYYYNNYMFWKYTTLLHRPLFIKFSLLNHKTNHIPSYYHQVLVLNGQVSCHVILIFRIILISKRGYRSRLAHPFRCPPKNQSTSQSSTTNEKIMISKIRAPLFPVLRSSPPFARKYKNNFKFCTLSVILLNFEELHELFCGQNTHTPWNWMAVLSTPCASSKLRLHIYLRDILHK